MVKTPPGPRPSPHRRIHREYVVAVIGLVGVLVTAIVSNWDKLSGNVVTAEYSGYRPTGNIETELRYFLEVNGLRAQMKTMQDEMLGSSKKQIDELLSDNPRKARQINAAIAKSAGNYDEIVNDMIPVWKRHFTLDQVQKLNKFYSTQEMQDLVRAQPQMTKELMQVLIPKMQQQQEKLVEEISEILSADDAEPESASTSQDESTEPSL